MRPALHGWLLVDKPVGLGSTQAVAAVKRALREGGYARTKVGHGGTLDPLASGVLPVALGEATKLAGRLLDSDKEYTFSVRFGIETATLDREGAVTATSDARPLRRSVEAVLARFLGPQEQVPPAFSALKVDGRRAYDRARDGEDVILAPRRITVHDLSSFGMIAVRAEGDLPAEDGTSEMLFAPRSDAWAGRNERVCRASFRATVSKGTYIRSLARDIAAALGTVGHVTYLRRLKAGPFGFRDAWPLDILPKVAMRGELEHLLLPVSMGLDDIPALSLTPDQAGALRQGRVLAGIAARDGQYFATLGSTPVALVEAADGNVRVVRGFNL